MTSLLLGAFIISFSAVFVKIAQVPPTTSAFYRVFVAGVALALYHLATRRPWLQGRTTWLTALGCGLAFLLDLFCWHRSIIHVGPGLATLLGNFQVLFLSGVAVFWFKEKLGGRFAASTLLALAGIGLITGLDWSGFSADYRLGLAYGMATALFYAVYLLCLKRLLSLPGGRDPVAVMTGVCLIASALFFLATQAEGVSLAIPDIASGLSLLTLGLVCQVGGWVLISRGMSVTRAAHVGLILLLQPTLSFVWDVLFFHRPFGLMETAGAALALTGIYIGSTAKVPAPRPGA